MAAIVYLDVDDEITSAAARIRAPGEIRVALVIPYGSRLATSRINFRLLAREAQSRGRRLSIVAADPASRALAASAGLPVFRTVDEYEAADGPASTVAADPGGSRAHGATDAPPEQATDRSSGSPTGRAAKPAPDEPAEASTILIPPATLDVIEPAYPPRTTAAALTTSGELAHPVDRDDRSSLPVIRSLGRYHVGRTTLAIALAAFALTVIVAGVGAYVLLPSAEIVVRPIARDVGPISVDVRADPTATAVDVASGIVPAQRLTFDLQVADAFASTGQRVEAERATGVVTFDSINTVGPVAVPEGTRVSTLDGVVFLTTQAVTVPAAKVAGSRIEHGFADAPVRAQRAGPAGNVDAGDIVQVPASLDTQQVSVSNREPTSGGVRNEFPQVTQEDVDKAIAALTERLSAEFTGRLADPASVPEGLTVFPETSSLTAPTPATDPAELVGAEVPEFQLTLTATGSVTAVDERPIGQVAETRLRSSVTPGHRLVAGSVQVSPGEPVVEGEIVSFPVAARASEILVPDADALRAEVRGLSADEARTRLARYGAVDVRTWPDWVTTITTVDFRLDLRVETDVETEADAIPSPASP